MTGAPSFLLHLLAEPATWLARLLNLPSTPFWAPYIAILFFFLVLCLAWWSFSFWKHHKYHFYIFLYLFLLGLAAIGYLIIILYPYAWIYGSFGILVGLITVWRTLRTRSFSADLHRTVGHFVFVGIMISVVLPGILFFHYQFSTNRLYTEMDTQLRSHTAELNKKVSSADEAAAAISQDTFLLTQLQQGQTTGLTTSLQEKMLEKGLQFVTLTNPLATVITRAHQPLVAGDNLFEQLPWIAPLFKGTKVNGLAFNEKGLPIAVGVASVGTDKRLGIVLAGTSLGDQFCQQESGRVKQSLAIGTSSGLVSNCSLNARQDHVLTSGQFNSIIKQTAQGNEAVRAEFQLNGEQYLTLAKPVTTIVPNQYIVLGAIRQDAQPSWIPLVDSLGVLLVSIVVLIAFEKVRKKRHD